MGRHSGFDYLFIFYPAGSNLFYGNLPPRAPRAGILAAGGGGVARYAGSYLLGGSDRKVPKRMHAAPHLH
jgi:hypothetical protein